MFYTTRRIVYHTLLLNDTTCFVVVKLSGCSLIAAKVFTQLVLLCIVIICVDAVYLHLQTGFTSFRCQSNNLIFIII
jgi:hypothetical protein